MDPNMFGTNAQWAAFFKFVIFVLVALLLIAFGLGAWIF